MTQTQYIGSRYVPVFADEEWSDEYTYEPLTVVLHDGNSYTSHQSVPKGIDIGNTNYWALTGNYNAQVEKGISKAEATYNSAKAEADTIIANLGQIGEGTEVAEVVDARVNGVTSKTYTTLKNRCDGDYTALSGEIDQLINGYHEMITSVYSGGFISAVKNSGILNVEKSSLSTRIRTSDDFSTIFNQIKIEGGIEVEITVGSGYRYAVQLYDGVTGLGLVDFIFRTETMNIFYEQDVYAVLMLARLDDSDISESEISNVSIHRVIPLYNLIDNKLDYTKTMNLTDDEKETARNNIGAGTGRENITLPFSGFSLTDSIYKLGNTYSTDIIAQSKAISTTGKTVAYIAPNGSHTADGLTVLTPVKTINEALAVANVGTIICLEGTYTAGTNYFGGNEITSPVNIIGLGEVIFDNMRDGTSYNPIKFKTSAYVENIHFKHGANTVIAELTASDTVTFNRCTFSESDTLNGLAILGGKSYVIDCVAYGNGYDGFNYHANGSVVNHSFEVGCTSFGNGTYDLSANPGQSSNATTSHDGSYIVRVNGDYKCCHGGVVADKECHSANYGCSSGVSTVTDSTNYPDRLSNYWSSNAQMWLYDCVSYGSLYDTARINGGVITSDIVYPSNYPS